MSYNYNKEALALPKHLALAGLIDGTYEGYMGESHGTLISSAQSEAKMIKSAYSSRGIIMPSRFTSNSTACGPLDGSPLLRDGGKGWFIAEKFNDYLITPIIPESVAYQLDIKMDDGKPLAGNVGVSSPAWNSTVHVLSSAANWGNAAVLDTYTATSATPVKIVFINQY